MRARILALYPSRGLSTLTDGEVSAVQQHMVDDGLSRKTINDRMARCRTFVRWAIKNRHTDKRALDPWVIVSPLLYGQTEAVESSPIVSVEEADIRATLPHLSDVVQRMVLVQLATGMRSTELCKLRWEHIQRRGGDWVYTPPVHKTQHYGHNRYVPLPENIKKLLGPTRRSGLTFPNARGKPYTRDTYRQSIVRAIDKAGCNHWTPLQIRHNAATRWFDEAGYDVASVLLGHRDRRSTSRYIDQQLDDVLRAAKKVHASTKVW